MKGRKMKRIRSFSLIVFCLLLSSMVFSQEKNYDLNTTLKRKNAIDVTLGGTGLFISANYSRIIAVNSNYFVNVSVGVGSVPMVGGTTLPHQLTINFGKESSFLELGIGGTFWSGKSNASAYTETISLYVLSPVIGWRKIIKNKFVFRAYANPLFHVAGAYYIEDYAVVPYLGVSVGYSF